MTTKNSSNAMKEQILLTKNIPNQAVILLVDVQQDYFNEVLDALESTEREERMQQIEKRLEAMKKVLLELKGKGHPIYAIADKNSLHPTLKGVPSYYLPNWHQSDAFGKTLLHPTVLRNMKEANAPVVTCGLWLELCVLEVTQLLQKNGVLTYIAQDPAITFENALVWGEGDEDVIHFDEECESKNIQIIEC